MRAAYRLRGIGWMLSGVVIVLGCYLVSLQVASERKRVGDLRHAIRQAQRQIRALETEFETRANIAQLERWNGDALALAAPTPAQFVSDPSALGGAGAASEPHAELAMIVPHARVIEAPPVAPAPAPASAPAPVMAAAQSASLPPVARSAPRPLAPIPVAREILASASITPAAPLPRARDRLASIALLDKKLSGDRGIGALVASIPIEGGVRK